MPTDVVVVGSYVQDHAWRVDRFPTPGETMRATGFSTGPGGKGFNQAVAAQRLGTTVRFVGALGADALADTARSFAVAEGLDCRWQTVDAPTAASSIVVERGGQNLIAVAFGANAELGDRHIRESLADCKAARVFLTQLETTLQAVGAVRAAAAETGALAILNPAPFDASLPAMLAADFDVLTPNETEFALLIETLSGTALAADEIKTLDDAELHELCRRTGAATVIITLGASGAFVSHRDDVRALRRDGDACYRVPPFSVRTVDTTGAGDAFNGALAARLALAPDAGFAQHVEFANRAAALSTTRIGTAAAMPSAAEMRRATV